VEEGVLKMVEGEGDGALKMAEGRGNGGLKMPEGDEESGVSLVLREGDRNLTIHLNITNPFYQVSQGVIKKCRLSWLTNSAPSYMSPNAGWGVEGSQPMSTAVHRSPNKN
jgi:hypothetical protein